MGGVLNAIPADVTWDSGLFGGATPSAQVYSSLAVVSILLIEVSIPSVDTFIPLTGVSIPPADAFTPLAEVSISPVDIFTPSVNVPLPIEEVYTLGVSASATGVSFSMLSSSSSV